MDTGQLEDPIPAGAHETLPARYYTDRDVFADNDLYLRHMSMSGPDA